jgi:hypothetical protein
MAAVKNILKHVSTEIAGRKRRCSRNRTHSIIKGDTCLVVRDGPQKETTYCAVCAGEILVKADEMLVALHRPFDNQVAKHL